MAHADPFAAPLALLEDILKDEVVAAEGEMGVVALLLTQRDEMLQGEAQEEVLGGKNDPRSRTFRSLTALSL